MNMENKKYKNLLFDLGGVIMDIERERCVAAYTAMGMTNANDLLGVYVQSGPFLALENGDITPAQFRAEIRKNLTREATDAEIDAAFCEFLIGIPKHRLEELRALRKEYKIYLLSNTNPIMWDSKIKECFRIEGFEREDYFDGMITSFEANCSKPAPKIFEDTISKLGIKAEDTIFFDDSQKNLDAAAKFGFGTYLVKPGTEFMDYFNRK